MARVFWSLVAELRERMTTERLAWRSFVDCGPAGTGPIATEWNHTMNPTLYVIDNRGVIRHKWTGAPDPDGLDRALETLIEAAERDGGTGR